MYMYVCIYVCVYLCMYMYVYVCVYVYMYVCVCVYCVYLVPSSSGFPFGEFEIKFGSLGKNL